MEPNSPKKIQFAVPLFQSQLDPQASEQIRKRRPTPATLVIFNEQTPPETDEKRTANNPGEAQSAEMSPKQRKQSVYTPPTMKGKITKWIAPTVEAMLCQQKISADDRVRTTAFFCPFHQTGSALFKLAEFSSDMCKIKFKTNG
ncbi:protein phosphatase 1 regulatory subunit 1C isoform X2 [Lepisosteus oculatus]|uniref:protein phosphatase 1 regulatory subunit 1C isoform X2 n=1 Tax=Lepisosteus oculatus TaxID=7918 RepID=UPI0007403F9D|nr:PREDICTED: protein phosphatase 1 regulatory subunit 1C isoform X2 [Lepisosteus oculatus]